MRIVLYWPRLDIMWVDLFVRGFASLCLGTPLVKKLEKSEDFSS